MDEYLARFFDDEEFVTACLVDATKPDRLTVVSCGHPPAMLVRADGSMQLLEAPAGLPLGLGGGYVEQTFAWHSGDRLLMYTDGLSEARDERGEFLPLLPLRPLVSSDGLDEALDHVLEAVRRHVPAGRLQDDLAVVLLENAPVDEQRPVELIVAAEDRTPAILL
jgi:serine phosphatase RsbU (regulator of sigma subunit)